MASKALVPITLGVVALFTGMTIASSLLENWQLAICSLTGLVLTVSFFILLRIRTALGFASRTQRRLDRVLTDLEATSTGIQALQEQIDRLENPISIEQVRQVQAAETKAILDGIASTRWDISGDTEALTQLFRDIGPKPLMPSTGRWAMDAKSLSQLLDLVRQHKPKNLLELGSGTSTIWLGHTLAAWGGKITSIDGSEEFLELTRANITKHGLDDTVRTRFAPLLPGSWDSATKVWYDRAFIGDIDQVDFLLVDGPPGGPHRPDSRYPAIPELIERLAPGALVVLDDSQRPDEQAAVKKWVSKYGLEVLDLKLPRLTVLRRI